MSNKEFDNWFLRNWRVGYAVVDNSGRLIREKDQDDIFETSSVIKVPVMKAFLEKASAENKQITDEYAVKEHHLSNGSGIVNWTDWKSLHISALIELTCIYSDCVTANVMIEEIGGPTGLEKYLRSYGDDQTKLSMEQIRFRDDVGDIQSVGVTSPRASARWLNDLLTSDSIAPVFSTSAATHLANICEPWFNPYHLDGWDSKNLLYKTGSMLNVDDKGTTVLNLVGTYEKDGQKYHFSFFSRGELYHEGADFDDKSIQESVASFVSRNILI